MLCSQGILPLPMLYLSAYFEKRRQDYYRHLLQVSQRAAWSEWITFFLRGVTHEATDAIERATRLMTLRHEYHAKLQKARLSALSIKLVDALFETPAVTLKRTSTLLQLTPAAAQKHIDRLIDAGIIHEATHQKRNRVYLAAGILSILGDDNLAAAGSSLEERRSTKKEDNVSPTDL
jgi:Fic family protein